MENKTIYLGSHVGMNGPDYYLGSVKEAISYGSTTFMFYTGAPQNSYRKPLNELKIEEGRKRGRERKERRKGEGREGKKETERKKRRIRFPFISQILP